jgi:tRNA nucleotidyltransferase (CCA-adding enzyme)
MEVLDNPVLGEALPVLHHLNQNGFSAYFVGGSVRDILLGKMIADVDIATSAQPEEVMALFPNCIPTGLKHGTVTVVKGGRHYEITTFRTESEYENHRRPAQVKFIRNLEDDLLRRDFTVNAMALDASGLLSDPYGGLNDLRSGILRCVGNADARLQEDALRMLRAVRFASEYRFTIAKSTWRALLRYRSLLAHIATERIGAELDKMIGGASPERALALLARSGLWKHTNLQLPFADEASGQRCATSGMDDIPDTELRWAVLWIGLRASAGQVRSAVTALSLGKRRAAAISGIVDFHNDIMTKILEWHRMEADMRELHAVWIELVLIHGPDAAEQWLKISTIAEIESAGGLPGGFPEQALNWLYEMPAATLKDLAVDGSDLLAACGKVQGIWVKSTLERLLRWAANGSVPNEREALLREAKLLVEKERS